MKALTLSFLILLTGCKFDFSGMSDIASDPTARQATLTCSGERAGWPAGEPVDVGQGWTCEVDGGDLEIFAGCEHDSGASFRLFCNDGKVSEAVVGDCILQLVCL